MALCRSCTYLARGEQPAASRLSLVADNLRFSPSAATIKAIFYPLFLYVAIRYNRMYLLMNHHRLTLSDYQALAEFRYQIRRFQRFSEDRARRAGIEPQHHQIMLAIKGKPAGEESRIAYLAERLQIQHHSAVELVDRLARKGLITRTRSAEDRREVLVKLTPRGEQILGELTSHTSAELRSAAPALVAILRKLAITPRITSSRRRIKTAASVGV